MGQRAKTFQHIADILSFQIPHQDLKRSLSDPGFDWDAIVVVGSEHLVLPAIYCRLKSKQLLSLLPKDLNTYLEKLSAINRNRNNALLEQMHSISQLLNAHQIEHVFLKGAALLAHGCLEDLAERMVGDIDILISKAQIHQAFNLLKQQEYSETFGFAYENTGFRHLDRLISKKRLAAVELHNELLTPDQRHCIDVEDVLKTKVLRKDIPIPNEYYTTLHHILAWQINDLGFYYKSIHFKYLYDSLCLKVFTKNHLIAELLMHRYGRSYLQCAKLYFKEFSEIESDKSMIRYGRSHQKYRDQRFYRTILTPLKQSYKFTTHRIHLLLFNPSYRQHAFKKIFILEK